MYQDLLILSIIYLKLTRKEILNASSSVLSLHSTDSTTLTSPIATIKLKGIILMIVCRHSVDIRAETMRLP
jgi:hypothetical protein